jgi:pyruvate dehydrogenase E2 component (dihydrolipoyllysine-residue acetyltransferase)
MTEVAMPRLSDSMEEGAIVRWLVSDGDVVERGQEIVEIETDKATMPFEAEAAGVISLIEPEGATLPVGATIARIGTSGSNGAGAAAAAAERPAELAAAVGAAPVAARKRPDRPNASPIARRAAEAAGVDLQLVAGSGPHGRILKADVLAAVTRAEPVTPTVPEPPRSEGAKGPVEVLEPSRLQRTVARRMAESKATQPDFSVSLDVDMGEILALREQVRGEDTPAPTINDFIVRATAVTLRSHPRLNGAFRADRFELFGRVNVGIAIATDDGLIVPTIFDADRLSLGATAAEARRLSAAVRGGAVVPGDLEGGTFTVSNLGMFGIVRFAGVINPPQAAILCVGAVEQRPAVRDGSIVARPLMTLTLVCDHRIAYGADAARFLAELARALERPLPALI